VPRWSSAYEPAARDASADLDARGATLEQTERRGGMASIARILSGRYRGPRRRARGLMRDGVTLNDLQLYRDIATARDTRTQWRGVAQPGHPPRPVAGFEQLADAYQALSARLMALDAVLPDLDLAALPARDP